MGEVVLKPKYTEKLLTSISFIKEKGIVCAWSKLFERGQMPTKEGGDILLRCPQSSR
jgi:hypothetical protein